MPVDDFNFRFIVDETSFEVGGRNVSTVNENLLRLADLLSDARRDRERVAIVGAYQSSLCSDGRTVQDLLDDNCLDQVSRRRLAGLLDKCALIDSDPNFAVLPALTVDGNPSTSYGLATIAWLRRRNINAGAMVFYNRHSGPRISITTSEISDCDVVLVDGSMTRTIFRQWALIADDVQEADFFERAPGAFPSLRFASGLTFRRFEGTYDSLRDEVIRHLSAINNSFLTSYYEQNGKVNEVSARVGIDMSMESVKTRKSKVMAQRDVVHEGVTRRCEWHSKIEPHRNRIHFFPVTDADPPWILIGIFVAHLGT